MPTLYSPLVLGDDLSGRKIYVKPQGSYTVTEEKVIARASSTNYFYETAGNVGYCKYKNAANTITTITFYQNGGYMASFDLPDDFGVLYEVDDSAVLYGMLKRIANQKVYGFTEDMNRVEVT